MARPRFVADEQSLMFPALVPDGDLTSTVAIALVADSVPEVDLLTQRIVDFLDLYPEAREIWLVAPSYAQNAIVLARNAEELSRRVSALGISGLRGFVFDESGRWSEDGPTAATNRGLLFDDGLVDAILDVGGRAAFVGTSSLLTAHSGYHFGKPSGSHSKYFLRAAGAVDRRLQAMLVAVTLLRRTSLAAIKKIWTDTAGIFPVASAIGELRRGYLPHLEPLVTDSFGGYAGLSLDLDRRFREGDLALISSSTSGKLAARLRKVAPQLDGVHTLYGVSTAEGSDDAWLSGVVFDLTASPQKRDDATISTFESSKAEDCKLCSIHHEATVALEGDGFFPATGGVTARKIDLADSSRALSDLMTVAAGRSVLRVRHLDGAKHPARRTLATRVGHLLAENEGSSAYAGFRETVAKRVQPLLKSRRRGLIVVHLNDDDSAQVANFVSGLVKPRCRVISADDPGFDEILSSPEVKHVLVVAGVIASGRSILNISRRLRFLQPTTTTAYFVVVAHPESVHAFDQVTRTLTIRGSDPCTGELIRSEFAHGWVVFRDTLDESDDGWSDEARFLTTLSEKPGSPYAAIRARQMTLMNHADSAIPKRLFISPETEPGQDSFPGMQRYFVFWDIKWQGTPSEEEVYYTVQCVLHNNRRSGKSGQYALVNDGGDRFVIEPHMFDRFNDPVLQASILRAAGVGELDYSSDETFSRMVRGMIEFMVDRASFAEAAAVNEFLMSLCLGLNPGRTRHLRISSRDLRSLALKWSEDGTALSLPPLAGALTQHLIEAADLPAAVVAARLPTRDPG